VGKVFIGISGWRYAPWRGVFYPKNLPQRAELDYVSRIFSTLEINGSFYSLQRPESYASWHEHSAADFVFALKGGRYITHMLKLRNVEKPLANFFASGVFNLKEKLGPILWQLPPNLRYDRDRMARFFDLLPHDTAAAAKLARKRDDRLKGRCRLSIDENRALRHAVEIRHESFLDPSFVDLLREHNIALVVAETARRWPMTHDLTADFVYVRLHGDKHLYQSGYGSKALDRWAARIDAWRRGGEPDDAHKISSRKAPRKQRDVYCYFDNTDVKLRAPFDAQSLMRKLGIERGGAPRLRSKRPGFENSARPSGMQVPARHATPAGKTLSS
jgi:uncharacterized protein YecE (DUF72 family)